MKTDHELIRQFQKDDHSAFDELVKRHLDSVYRFFLKITGDEMDAEDLAQTVFIKCYKGLKRFRFEAEFTTYLYRAKVNTANSYLSRNKWRNFLHLDQTQEQSYSKDDTPISKSEIWTHVAKLPTKQRNVVMIRLNQQLPFKDIGLMLNMTEGSAKVNYHHGINKLREWLKDEYEL